MKNVEAFQMNENEISIFLHKARTGRMATINTEGFPVIIPLNFVYLNNRIYLHTAPIGEKVQNILGNSHVGFEADQNIVTLPAYYFYDSNDPSEADTLYRSVVIKGYAKLIESNEEKVYPLQKLMEKYQSEGLYQPVTTENKGLQHVEVIEIKIDTITGKKKIGQHWSSEKRLHVAEQIMKYNQDYEEIFNEIGLSIENGKISIQEN